MERKIKITLLALLSLTMTGCDKDESWRAKVDGHVRERAYHKGLA